jgi:hypothetical protein
MLAVVCLGVFAAFALRWKIWNGVNRANYDRIQVGMAEAEVEAIMGGPGEKLAWLDQEDLAVDERPSLLIGCPVENMRCWHSAGHQISVSYDATGHVVSKYYTRPQESGFLQRFFDWLGL